MLAKDALLINRALESILCDPMPVRNYRLEKLATEVEELFGDTSEGQIIIEGIRSWMEEKEERR